jgi:hypothetical protein
MAMSTLLMLLCAGVVMVVERDRGIG